MRSLPNSVRNRDNSPLTMDQIKRTAPSVFAATPYFNRSDKYRFIPTTTVLDILAERHFLPVQASQSNTRIAGKGDFTKHMLRFRQSDNLGNRVVGSEVPEVVLINSHDGTSAYKFLAGIFRLVCSNGMIVQSSDMGSVSVRHSSSDVDFSQGVLDATFEVTENAGTAMQKIEGWKRIELPQSERLRMAEVAKELIGNDLIRPAQLLNPLRYQDQGNDLWRTFNVIQEHALMGGDRIYNPTTGRRNTTRTVKDIGKNVKLNSRLWNMAEEFARRAA